MARMLSGFGAAGFTASRMNQGFHDLVAQDDEEVEDDHGNLKDGTATLITAPGSVSGSLETGDDIDVFRITIETGGDLTISTTGSTDTIGVLYRASDLVELDLDDDSGPGSNFSITVEAGDYYLEVHPYTTGAYTLVVDQAVEVLRPARVSETDQYLRDGVGQLADTDLVYTQLEPDALGPAGVPLVVTDPVGTPYLRDAITGASAGGTVIGLPATGRGVGLVCTGAAYVDDVPVTGIAPSASCAVWVDVTTATGATGFKAIFGPHAGSGTAGVGLNLFHWQSSGVLRLALRSNASTVEWFVDVAITAGQRYQCTCVYTAGAGGSLTVRQGSTAEDPTGGTLIGTASSGAPVSVDCTALPYRLGGPLNSQVASGAPIHRVQWWDAGGSVVHDWTGLYTGTHLISEGESGTTLVYGAGSNAAVRLVSVAA